MSLSIFHELDHPTHPITAEETASIVGGARIGGMAAREHDGEPWLDIMSEVYERSGAPSNTREFFIGEAIGVYAGLIGLGIQGEDSSAFNFTGEEMIHIRDAKQRGVQLREQYDPNLVHTYSALVRRLGTGSLFPDEPSTLVGLGIGLRYADLSRSIAREAAA